MCFNLCYQQTASHWNGVCCIYSLLEVITACWKPHRFSCSFTKLDLNCPTYCHIRNPGDLRAVNVLCQWYSSEQDIAHCLTLQTTETNWKYKYQIQYFLLLWNLAIQSLERKVRIPFFLTWNLKKGKGITKDFFFTKLKKASKKYNYLALGSFSQ